MVSGNPRPYSMYFFLGLPKLRLIMIAVSLWGNPLCRWPWWMFPVGGEKSGGIVLLFL